MSELDFALVAARRLAECSDSNRWGEPYYVRKAAFAQLRGALAVLDTSGAKIPLGASEIIDAARALAWWSHCNLGSPSLYRARQESFARLRTALR